MRLSEARPLYVSLEIIANYIYLSRHSQTDSAQQHHYLDCAADEMDAIAQHPMIGTWS
jgi:hypothetical protein